MNIVPRLGLLATVSASIAVCTVPVAFAETVVEIKANDTLGAIVSEVYPGYRNRDALMQLILERNPEAFIDNNINFLVLGKTLNLPGADELGAAIQTAPPPPPVQQVDSSVAAAEAESRLKQITEERDQLKQQLEQLETDNRALRDTVSRLEATGVQQSEQLKKLDEQIEALQNDAKEQSAAADTPSPEVVKQLAESGEKLEQLQARYDESVKGNQELQQQLTTLEEQIETLKSAAEKQSVTADIPSPEVVKQLAESGEKLEQLQARYDESVKNSQELQQQLTEKAALESEANERERQLTELQTRYDESVKGNQELQQKLKKLEEQIEALNSDAEKQPVAADTPSPEVVKQLAESGEKLEQLQARYDESVKNSQELQQQLTEKAALESEASELKQQLTELQNGSEIQKTANAELQSQLDTLKQQSESLRAENEKVLSELNAVNAKLEVSESDADALRTALDASNKQLEVSQSEVATLRTELSTSNENNTALSSEIEQVKAAAESEAAALRTELNTSNESNAALSSEIDQIKAAAEKDVALAPAEPADKPGSTWWPWLLALLLLPVAWLLGQRSRPVAATPVPEAKTGVKTIEIAAAADPVVPEALTSDQLDQMAFSGIQAVTKPDDPDAAIKLDMARAYLDLRNAEAANDVLKEVIEEGGSRQQQEAKEIQSFIA